MRTSPSWVWNKPRWKSSFGLLISLFYFSEFLVLLIRRDFSRHTLHIEEPVTDWRVGIDRTKNDNVPFGTNKKVSKKQREGNDSKPRTQKEWGMVRSGFPTLVIRMMARIRRIGGRWVKVKGPRIIVGCLGHRSPTFGQLPFRPSWWVLWWRRWPLRKSDGAWPFRPYKPVWWWFCLWYPR